MSLVFIALALILAGGILPLFAGRNLRLIKATGATGVAAGSLLGLLAVAPRLLEATVEQASFAYLQVLHLDFRLDALAAFFLVTIFAICSLAAIYSVGYLHRSDQARRTAAHYLCFALLTVAMALVVLAENLLAFLLAWEAMSLSSFFLVMYDHEAEENRRAGYLYFVFSQVGAHVPAPSIPGRQAGCI